MAIDSVRRSLDFLLGQPNAQQLNRSEREMQHVGSMAEDVAALSSASPPRFLVTVAPGDAPADDPDPPRPERRAEVSEMADETTSAESVQIPDLLPVLPLKDVVLFPYVIIPLSVSREKSIAAVDAALAEQRILLLLAQRDPSVEEPGPADLYETGTAAAVMRMLKLPDGRIRLLVQGLSRVRVDGACVAIHLCTTLAPVEWDVSIGPTRHAYFNVRVAESMRATKGGTIVDSEGRVSRGPCWDACRDSPSSGASWPSSSWSSST